MKKSFCIALLLIGIAALQLRADSTKTEKVSVKGGFDPATITIKVNDSISWSNDDDSDHDISADDNSFDSGNLKSGKTFTHQFTSVGSFGYHCSLHPREKGTVVVEK